MDDVIDRVMTTFAMMRSVDHAQLEASRIKLTDYIGKLTSEGQHDEQRLAVQGLAYMRELHEAAGRGQPALISPRTQPPMSRVSRAAILWPGRDGHFCFLCVPPPASSAMRLLGTPAGQPGRLICLAIALRNWLETAGESSKTRFRASMAQARAATGWAGGTRAPYLGGYPAPETGVKGCGPGPPISRQRPCSAPQRRLRRSSS